MPTINLYQPGKIDVTLNFPASWNELRPEEVVFIAKTLLEQTEETADQTRPLILKYLIESRALSLPKDWFLFINPDQAVTDGFPLLDFIFLKNDLTNLPGRKLLGKEEFFPVSWENIICGEYEDCDVIAGQFAEAPSEKLLASLAAILFRPKRNGALLPYLQYNYRTDSYYTYQYEKKIPHFLKLPPEELYAIFIWYAGSRNQLPGMFPHVYNGGGTGEPDILAFTRCIHSGAGSKNGTREKIRVMRLYEFMFDMDEEARKAEEMEREIANQKNT